MFYRPRSRKTAQLNMTPMIDLIFLLLIFFMVATVFPENDGVVIEKPKADTGAPLRSDHLLVAVTADGQFRHDGAAVDPEGVALLISRELAANPGITLVVKADRRADTEYLVRLLDIAREQGLTRMALATEKTDGADAAP
ncbi:MAG: biopolymer transporter ExbD [Nitrospinae bacterium]|nr:biopolymer transporter ExbD [Nitrospinota bacterium]